METLHPNEVTDLHTDVAVRNLKFAFDAFEDEQPEICVYQYGFYVAHIIGRKGSNKRVVRFHREVDQETVKFVCALL